MMAPFFNSLKFFKELITEAGQRVANGTLNFLTSNIECYNAFSYESKYIQIFSQVIINAH
jgi:hypothetical protein